MSITAMKHYEAALMAAFPHGAAGKVSEHWDKARQAIAEAEKQEPIGTAGELFTNAALERLDFRPSTKIYTPPQQEILLEPEGRCKECLTYNGHHDGCSQATPQPQQEKRESVPVCEYCEKERPVIHTPQREWVGLTDEETDNFLKAVWGPKVTAIDFVRAIETKLKERNG